MKEILRVYFNEEFAIRKEEYEKARDNLRNLIVEYEEELKEWFESALGCTVRDFHYNPWKEELRLHLFLSTDKEIDEVDNKILSLNLPFDLFPISVEPDEDEEI